MDSDAEDVKKMTEFLKQQKSQDNCHLEFLDFVSFKPDGLNESSDLEDVYDETNIIDINDVTKILSEEEKTAVDTTNNKELKQLLIWNRSKNMQLMKLHKKIYQLLQETQEEVREKESMMKTSGLKHSGPHSYVWKLLAPYFKDKNLFPSPLNEEAIKKRQKGELGPYDFVPASQWTPTEFENLISAVKCNYNINKQNHLVKKINKLKSKKDSDDEDETEEESLLKNQLQKLASKDEIPPQNSNEFINWYKVADTFLKDKHTPLECESVWHILIHPDINKSEWTNEENARLKRIAKQNSFQNWDFIAKELGTKRTGFTTCLHYFSKLCDKFKKAKFTPEEDSFLLDVINTYKIDNFIMWNKVVCHFNNRSRHQLYHRYTYFLSQNHVKKGKFSAAEDILLMVLVNKFGKQFRKFTEYMPHRSQMQLKCRYNNNLQREIKKGTFTVDEDQAIVDHVQKNGEKFWGRLSVQLQRCGAQLRQRYKFIKNYLNDHPATPVAVIPKRKHNFNTREESNYDFLSIVAAQFEDRIPTLKMIEEILEVDSLGDPGSSNLHESNIAESSGTNLKVFDSLITNFFTKVIQSKQYSGVTEASLNEATENVEELLNVLGVTLDIPDQLECNDQLDNIDLEILENIAKKQKTSSRNGVHGLVPPNINTLTGLRTLIVKHKEYRSEKNKASRQNIMQNSSHTFHQDQFSSRFNSLFEWSATLSLEKPNPTVLPETSENHTNVYSKKRKIETTGHIFRCKNPKLDVSRSNVNFNHENTFSEISVTETEDSIDIDDDLEEREQLDAMLKSMKPERCSS